MSLALTDRLKLADEVLTTRVDSETVILNLKTGTYYGLDPVGTRFFELLKSVGDLSEVHGQLLAEFDVSADTLEADLLAFSEEMEAKGILVRSQP